SACLTPPGEQLLRGETMPARHRRHDRARRQRLLEDPRPLIRRPAPAPHRAVDHLKASDLDLRLKSMVKPRHKTILQQIVTLASQAPSKKVPSERRTVRRRADAALLGPGRGAAPYWSKPRSRR